MTAKKKEERKLCGVLCHGTTHKPVGCQLEAGHGGMHFHGGRKRQHVYHVQGG